MTRSGVVVRLVGMARPITTINPHLGDESFVARFGRLPTPHDDIRTRVATHVGHVATVLRERDVSHLSQAEQARRAMLLGALDAYVAAGAFPDSETDEGLLPTFLDATSGVRCAVALLVETSAGTAMMEALDRDHHNDYIDDLANDPRFTAWTESSGFTHEELAWIQPSYPPPPPTDIRYELALEGRLAVDRATQPDAPVARAAATGESPAAIGLADGSLRWVARDQNPFYGRPALELDGAIGMTSDTHTAYDVAAKLGSEVRFAPHVVSIDAGLELDAYGPAMPRAWSLPIELAYIHDGRHHAAGIHGGPRFSLDGARDTGWNVGLEVRRKHAFRDDDRWHPSDLVISLDATHLAGATFLGLTVGVGNARSHGWWED